MKKIKNNVIKVSKKATLYINLILKFASKHKSTIVISFLSVLLAGCLGFGIYKYLTTPRAPNLKTAKGSYLYAAKGLDFTAFIGNKENNRPDVTFEVGKGSVVFTPASGNEKPSTPSADGKKAVIFKDVYSNIDFRYQTMPLGVKEEIIVKKATPIRTFPFFLDFKGVTPQYVTDNIKGTAFYDKDGGYLFNFEKPFAIDAKGARSDNFGISIRKDTETGKYVAIITADDVWMNDPVRAYPITIDPTIVHDTTSEFATGQMNRVKDTGSGSSPNLETYYQEVKSDPYTVALWHMDEASGNLTDASGNGNTGTPTGTTVVDGIISNGRSFNGASDYVTVANSTLLNLSNSGFTISSWVKISNLADSTQHYIVSRYSYSSNTGYGLYVVNSGKVGCDFNGSTGRFESTNAYVTAGQWYHLACRNENGRLSIFVDGVEKESIVRSTALSNYNGNLYLGTPSDGVGNTNYTLSGVIDDVKISNIARTPEEISLDASRRPDSTYTSPVMDLTKALSWNSFSWTGLGLATGDGETATPSASSNVAAQWNFNETSGTSAVSGGNCGTSCNGTLTNFSDTSAQDTTTAVATGGTITYSGGYVIHTFTSSGTFTAYRPLSTQVLVVSGGGRGNQGGGGAGGVIYNSAYSVSAGSNTVTVGAGGTSGTPTGGTSSFGTVTIGGGSPGGTGIASAGGNSGNGYSGGTNAGGEGSGGGAGAAANGANATGNATISYGGNGGIGTSNSITGAATYYGGGGGGQGYHGSGTGGSGGGGNGGQSTGSAGSPNTGGGGGGGGSVGADGGSGVVIIRYPNAAQPSGWTANNRRWGAGALTFDGGSNQVVVANNANLNFNSTNSFSVEAWVNSSLKETNAAIISKTTAFDDNRVNYLLDQNPTDGWIFRVSDSSGTASHSTFAVTKSDYDTGKWVHLVGVYNSTTNTIYLYVNGILRAGKTVTYGPTSNTGSLYIGSYYTGNYFQGTIDSPKIYNKALSASEVLSNYNSGSIDLQTRVGDTNDPNDGTWEDWRPTNESVVNGMETISDWATPSASIYSGVPINTSSSTVVKAEGTGSLKIDSGVPKTDVNTVALWHFDETGGTGAYLKDSSANAYNGTPTGTSTAEGISGKSRSFNGSSDSATFPGLTWTPTTFSVEFWINPATCVDYNQQVQATNGWGAFYFHTTSTCSLYVGTDVTNRFTPTDIPANTLTLNQWQNFAYTYDGTAGRLYKNGVLIAGPKTQTASTAWGGFSLTSQVNGKVDEIRISNIARSSEEIAEAYRMGRDHRISEPIPSTNLSSATRLPFYVASDRLGTFSQLTIGESAYANYETDDYTAGLWHLDDNTSVTATGGTITYSGGYTIHKFTSSGTFTPTGDMNVEVLVVGGGGGGASVGGGGGGGGYVYYSSFPISRQAYTVTVGNGGTSDASGQNSVFSTITASGGGAGGNFNATGVNGGSGGGGGPSSTTQLAGGTGSQGSNGGSGGNNTNWGGGGGGGGAGGVGSSAGTGVNGVNGGVGLANSIGGSSVYYAGGGGGGEVFGTAVGSGGNGGGGNANLNAAGSNGSPNTGGGGGGGSWNTAATSGGTGGSGVVIIRYKTSDTVVKDATGGSVSGNTASASFVQGKIGKARSFNGTSDYISIPDSTSLNPTSAITIDYWVKPTATGMQLNKGIWNEYYTYRGSSGNISLTLYTSAGSLEQYSLSSFDNDGQWHHFAATWSNSDGKIRVYKDGVLDAVSGTTLTGTINSQTNALTIGSGVDAGGYYFGGSLDEVRISNVARTADEIRQTYEFGTRTHNITFDFKAKLASGNLITGSGDYSFTVDETAYGSSAMANHLFLGDKIIVKENYDGTEYIAQGTVNSVNSSTGAVTVASWDTGSTFPSGGFTVNATVFKWQREYFDITGIPSFQKDALTRLTYRITDGSQGANIWLDDIRSSTGYLTTPEGSTITSSTGKRYFQYRAILSQNSLPAPSAALTSVTLDYISNLAPSTPSLDSPENGATGVLWTPQLKTTTVDLDSDYLEYKIVLCKDAGMSVSCQTFDQTSSQTGWSGQNTQSGTAYNTGTQAVYTVQTALDIGTTYYWKSYAIDPAGTNTWSATQSTPNSFTTLAAPLPASNCRILETSNDTSLTVVWDDNATNENAYEVQRSVDGAAFTTLHTGLAANTVTDTDTGITEAHTYQYRVAPYFTGPSYAPWCTTSTLSLQLGEFSVKGLDLKGLNLK